MIHRRSCLASLVLPFAPVPAYALVAESRLKEMRRHGWVTTTALHQVLGRGDREDFDP
ncbi:MAG: hypothetical protein WAK03_09295 [Methylocystis sp.]|jgi:hypothetical protein